MEQVTEDAEMKTLTSCLEILIQQGYSENYKVTDAGLKALKTEKLYQPSQVKVTDYYRFEGLSDPADESILYAIETIDGSKGTLVDSYGPTSDTKVTTFMDGVEKISKKIDE